jgi:NADH-quinone oxidoreductase subunit G
MRIGEALGQAKAKLSAAAVMLDITKNVTAFADCRYKELAWTEVQLPVIGDDVWYGGTAYKNRGGLGVQIPTEADNGTSVKTAKVNLPKEVKAGRGKLLVVPTVRLYNRERTFRPSELVHVRVPDAYVGLNSEEADRLKVGTGDTVEIEVDGGPAVQVQVMVDDGIAAGSAVLPRHLTTTAMPLALASASLSKVNVPQASKV